LFAKCHFRFKRERTLTSTRDGALLTASVRERRCFITRRVIYIVFFLNYSFYTAIYERKRARATYHRVNKPLNIADDRLYVMHQLYVIANNYLIPVACSHSCPFNPDTSLLLPYASQWDSHCPLVNHNAIPHRGPRPCVQPARSSDPTWCLRERREYTVEIYVLSGKEDSQYFKVKLSDLDSMGGQDDRSSFPTVTAKSCFGIPPNDVFVVWIAVIVTRSSGQSANFTLKWTKIMQKHARERNTQIS